MFLLGILPFCALCVLGFADNSVKDIYLAIKNGMQKGIETGHFPETFHKAAQDLRKIKNQKVANQAVCDVCITLTNKMLELRRQGATRENILNNLIYLCKTFAHYGTESCEGDAEIGIDTILYIIDNKKDLTAERVCAIYFQPQKCVDPDEKPWIIPIPDAIEKPTEIMCTYQSKDNIVVCQTSDTGVSSDKTFEILHLTDVHYDPWYTMGSDADCGEQLCCDTGSPKTPETTAGYWADRHVCDMPWRTFESLSRRIKKEHKNVDYVYFTGDIVSHRSYKTSIERNTETIKTFYELISNTLPNVTVYPVLGNHESHPTDFYSPDGVQNTNVSTQWILNLAAEEWSRWLPEETKSTILKGGYYTVLVKPGFRIIGLNSNVAFTSNIWLMYDDVDPHGQLKWLVGVLSEAEKNNERVHILSHIPPGEPLAHKQWTNQYRKIVERFSKTIAAQFNGHTHMDEWRVFYDNSESPQAVSVAFNGGSFTTFVGFNSNYRVYKANSKNLMVENYDQYIFNLTEANKKHTDPEWYKLYSFKEAYGLKDMSLDSLNILVNHMKGSKDLMRQYYKFLVRDSDLKMKEGCDDACLKKWWCTLTAVETAEVLNC